MKLKKVLLLGSGALKIGEAGEFDYSGSQAIKALKEENIEIILINPNIATNQTSKGMADKVYFLPITPFFVEQIIKKEKPEGIMLSFGGQTALNCGLELEKMGILKKHKVQVLGTPTKSIELSEDREKFAEFLRKLGLYTPRSIACKTVEASLKAAKEIQYPVICRAAFALGGKGSGFAENEKELRKLTEIAFVMSPQVLIEEDLRGWKEIEYEVVRDKDNNCITVCNMENFDPLGIHTGESIVVAPSQTLNNHEYHMLRMVSIKTIQNLGIVGECNIQFALDPFSDEYRIIEVNARLSRSSALASKATGYPLAYIAAKLGLGKTLPELKNSITKTTSAFFEPALDYVTVKMPRWDLGKFRKVSKEISTEMKSVGEIMAIGRSFEEAFQKGLRMLNIGAEGFSSKGFDVKNVAKALEVPTPNRVFAIASALDKGWTIEEIHELTGIDLWFLNKLENIDVVKKELKENKVEISSSVKNLTDLAANSLLTAKKYGFSDDQLARLLKLKFIDIRNYRKKKHIQPVVKQIDTLAAEFPAETNYLYSTYHGSENDVEPSKKKKVMVIGSGPYCIGSSVEFDWSCINVIQTLEKEGYETIMINCNPETVSTDFDNCDKLYFEELTLERILDIYHTEKPEGIIISTGGQIPNNLALKLKKHKVKVLGTAIDSIDKCEDRHKFSALLDKLKIDQPQWTEAKKLNEAVAFANEVGFPVLVRPSYVLSGAAMSVAYDSKTLEGFLSQATEISKDAPVVISKFEKNAKEIEIDAVAHEGQLVIYAVAEHIENAGVHSGDATIVLPPQRLYLETIKRIKNITKAIAAELKISGPFNIQFLAKNNEVKVIECNLRASRSFPFSSKVTGYNFIEIATYAMLDHPKMKTIKKIPYKTLELDHIGIKAAQFSFTRLKGADPTLGVEMASTGEVATFGDDLHETLLKSLLSVGFRIPKKNILVTIGPERDKIDLIEPIRELTKMGYKIFATEGTHKSLKEHGVKSKMLNKIQTKESPHIGEYLQGKKLDMVINIPSSYKAEEITDGYLIRRASTDANIPLITNKQIAELLIETLAKYTLEDLTVKSWDEYL
ncbi:MAG: carbamoyl-phosphate synthase (glutamine-hydrolyzing) large subunit [Candidatus Gracilibacteria bacterium]|nr:carbamoyl-phosphate synthase (glutamine-hydrolyzing) large subunit [Candidatus Gracilibacteria bacterium]